MLESFLIAVIVLKLKGWTFKTIFKPKIVQCLAAALLLSILVNILFLFGLCNISNSQKIAMKAASIIILVVLYLIYDQHTSYRSMNIFLLFGILGIAANKVVIKVNGGYMPVKPVFNHNVQEILKYRGGYILADKSTKLLYLADIIDVKYDIYSIGDLLIMAFISFIMYSIIKGAGMKHTG